MKEKFKAFLATKRGKIITLSFLGVFWAIMFMVWFSPGDTLLPDAADIAGHRMELKKLTAENAALTARDQQYRALKKHYESMKKAFWSAERDGEVETEFRSRVRTAATDANLTLNNLGSVRTSRINPELYYAEIDIQALGTIEVVTAFLRRIAAETPAMGWRRLDLRIGFRPGGNNDNNSSIFCNGVLRLIGYDGKSDGNPSGEAIK